MGKSQYERWCEKYRPIEKDTDDLAGKDKFETFGEEFEFVKSIPSQYVWTVVTGDNGKMYISNGRHYVNRLFYFITLIPWKIGEQHEILYA